MKKQQYKCFSIKNQKDFNQLKKNSWTSFRKYKYLIFLFDYEDFFLKNIKYFFEIVRRKTFNSKYLFILPINEKIKKQIYVFLTLFYKYKNIFFLNNLFIKNQLSKINIKYKDFIELISSNFDKINKNDKYNDEMYLDFYQNFKIKLKIEVQPFLVQRIQTNNSYIIDNTEITKIEYFFTKKLTEKIRSNEFFNIFNYKNKNLSLVQILKNYKIYFNNYFSGKYQLSELEKKDFIENYFQNNQVIFEYYMKYLKINTDKFSSEAEKIKFIENNIYDKKLYMQFEKKYFHEFNYYRKFYNKRSLHYLYYFEDIEDVILFNKNKLFDFQESIFIAPISYLFANFLLRFDLFENNAIYTSYKNVFRISSITNQYFLSLKKLVFEYINFGLRNNIFSLIELQNAYLYFFKRVNLHQNFWLKYYNLFKGIK